MAYTVNKLAKISGVSVRTLHFYDEIGLLEPAYYGDENRYRYYEEAQLLILQQILFFRELGFQLRDIQRIISDPDFNQITALESHRKILTDNLNQTQNLIETVDKTIAHLRGKTMMKLEDIFHGFNADKQKLYEDFLLDSGVSSHLLNKTKEKIKHWSKEQWLENKQQSDEIYAALVSAIHNHLQPASTEVQRLIKKHYEVTKIFWIPNRESYIALAQFYYSHPDFVNFYHELDPKLLDFLVAGMKIFAENELGE